MYDIHQTLHDILLLNNDAKDNRNNDKKAKSNDITGFNYGRSLFKEISPDRNCKAAGIDPSYCGCSDWKELSGNELQSELVLSLGSTVIKRYNG